MSRGHGKAQRFVLEALERRDGGNLAGWHWRTAEDLATERAGREPSTAEVESIRRAIRSSAPKVLSRRDTSTGTARASPSHRSTLRWMTRVSSRASSRSTPTGRTVASGCCVPGSRSQKKSEPQRRSNTRSNSLASLQVKPMPANQRGSVVKRGNRWQARWYDESGQRKSQGGFETKSSAREWVDDKTDNVAALRRGDLPTLRRQQMPTLGEFVEEFLAQHNAEASTLASLKKRLRYALTGPSSTARAAGVTSASTGSSSGRSAHGGNGYPHGLPMESRSRSGRRCTTPSA